MKRLSVHTRRRIRAIGSAAAVAIFGLSTYLAYRWAEPTPAMLSAAHTFGGDGASVRIERTPFAGYFDGVRTWSIFAGEVDLLRLPNASLSAIQSASIVDIRNGTLYEAPRKPKPSGPGLITTSVMEAAAAPQNATPIAATFHAKQGRYSVGMLDTAPPDIEMLFSVQWQFKLAGDVVFETRAHDVLAAPAMTIYSLVDRKTAKPEQRVICEQGGRMTHNGVQVSANSIRYNPKDHTLECLSGVRGTYKSGNVQAERAFWSLDDEVLRCPETATGVVEGMRYLARGVTLDMKHRKHRFEHIECWIDPGAEGRLGE